MRFERWKSLDAVIRAHLRCSNVAVPWSLPCPRTSTRTFCAWGGACSESHGGLVIVLVRQTEKRTPERPALLTRRTPGSGRRCPGLSRDGGPFERVKRQRVEDVP